MKKTIGLVVILAVLVLGSYYVMGLLTERTFKRNVDIINQSNGLLVDVERYDRGWFTSSSLVDLTLRFPSHVVKTANDQTTVVPAKEYKVQVPFKVFHGPIAFSPAGVKFGLGYASSRVQLPEQYKAKFKEEYTTNSTEPQLFLSLLVNYLNNSKIQMEVPTFNLVSKSDGSTFDWSGLNTQMNIIGAMEKVNGAVELNGWKMTKDKVKAMLEMIKVDYDLHQSEGGLYLGNASFSMPHLLVQNDTQSMFDLQEWNIRTESDIQADLFFSTFTSGLKKLMLNGKPYGPGLLEVSLKNLDATTMVQINQLSNKIQQSTTSERQQAVMNLLPLLPKLLSKGPVLEISKLSLVMPEGVVNGHLVLSLPKEEVSNPFQLIQKMQGSGSLTLPTKLVRDAMISSMRRKVQDSSLQQAMVQQMRNNAAAVQPPAPPVSQQTQNPGASSQQAMPAAAAQPATATAPATAPAAAPAPSPASQSLTAAEVEQQATTQADLRISAMLQSGLLTQQGNDYLIEFNLTQGQLSVNGKPFTAAQLQFQ